MEMIVFAHFGFAGKQNIYIKKTEKKQKIKVASHKLCVFF